MSTIDESSDSKKINLKTSDDQLFKVDEDVAMEFGIVKNFFDDDNPRDAVVPLLNVSASCLSSIIEYCRKHLELESKSAGGGAEDDATKKEREDAIEKERKEFDDEFLKTRDMKEILKIIVAVNYMNIGYLLETLNQGMAGHIENKSVEYVRDLFNIRNSEYTPQEEKRVREQNSWAFEGVED